MPTLRPELTPLPARISRLPVDPRGYPVPWFVAEVDGVPDFRVMDPNKFVKAVKEKRCWVCGDILGSRLAFVVGPMCVVNGTSSEPPCHYECALWSAKNCPFLTRTHMVRREAGLPEEAHAGTASIMRNPGCTAILITRNYQIVQAGKAAGIGYLVRMQTPERVEWYVEGRPATREEVDASIDSGMPALAKMCDEAPVAEQAECRKALADARASIAHLLPAVA